MLPAKEKIKSLLDAHRSGETELSRQPRADNIPGVSSGMVQTHTAYMCKLHLNLL